MRAVGPSRPAAVQFGAVLSSGQPVGTMSVRCTPRVPGWSFWRVHCLPRLCSSRPLRFHSSCQSSVSLLTSSRYHDIISYSYSYYTLHQRLIHVLSAFSVQHILNAFEIFQDWPSRIGNPSTDGSSIYLMSFIFVLVLSVNQLLILFITYRSTYS